MRSKNPKSPPILPTKSHHKSVAAPGSWQSSPGFSGPNPSRRPEFTGEISVSSLVKHDIAGVYRWCFWWKSLPVKREDFEMHPSSFGAPGPQAPAAGVLQLLLGLRNVRKQLLLAQQSTFRRAGVSGKLQPLETHGEHQGWSKTQNWRKIHDF